MGARNYSRMLSNLARGGFWDWPAHHLTETQNSDLVKSNNRWVQAARMGCTVLRKRALGRAVGVKIVPTHPAAPAIFRKPLQLCNDPSTIATIMTSAASPPAVTVAINARSA